MDIYNLYKESSYNNRFKGKQFLFSLDQELKLIKNELGTFFENDRIFITSSEILEIIEEINQSEIDEDFTVKVVVQKAFFNKKMASIKSGVTTKLAFLFRALDDGVPKWYLYGLASGLFNSRRVLNVTRTNPLAYTVYISLSDRESNASGTVKTALQKLREKMANKAVNTDP